MFASTSTSTITSRGGGSGGVQSTTIGPSLRVGLSDTSLAGRSESDAEEQGGAELPQEPHEELPMLQTPLAGPMHSSIFFAETSKVRSLTAR